jgi:hypothetical protein
VTAELLTCHALLYVDLEPFGIYPHYRSGHWVPHVTLSQNPPLLAQAVEGAASVWSEPIVGRLAKIELVRFPPVTVLQSWHLKL